MKIYCQDDNEVVMGLTRIEESVVRNALREYFETIRRSAVLVTPELVSWVETQKRTHDDSE
jgi:hypothetical protein